MILALHDSAYAKLGVELVGLESKTEKMIVLLSALLQIPQPKQEH